MQDERNWSGKSSNVEKNLLCFYSNEISIIVCNYYIHLSLFYLYIDEFILDTVVNTNDIVSDPDASDTVANTRPFGESSYSAIMSKGTTIGMHNAYIAMGTFASAIFIVAIVVSFYYHQIFSWFFFFLRRFEKFILLPFLSSFWPHLHASILCVCVDV